MDGTIAFKLIAGSLSKRKTRKKVAGRKRSCYNKQALESSHWRHNNANQTHKKKGGKKGKIGNNDQRTWLQTP
jgi:hypothetical protein